MNILFFITTICFFIWTARNILYWTALWQEKEYRLDRLVSHLRETVKGKKLLTDPLLYSKFLLVLAYGIIVFYDTYSNWYQIAICLLYLFELGSIINEFFGHRLKRPTATIKAYIIFGISFSIITIVYFLPLTDTYLWFLILDRITPLVVMLYVFFFAFPTEVYTDLTIQKAMRKLEQYKNIIVIAVSGSYGKSSTKEFIAQVLEEKYTVVKTYGSNNTPIGIAKTILHRITDSTDIFILEMGAYKKGEVAELCEIVKPQISVTTSVSDQHLSLYGSLENAIDTEVELLRALPRKGLALFNGNNINTLRLYQRCKKKKILYKNISKANDSADIYATNAVVNPDGVGFTVWLNNKPVSLKASVLGAHMIENILPAIYLANHLHIPLATIKKKLLHLTPPPKTMRKRILANGVIVIDDTFNASPESVMAAMKYMQVYKRKKIFVLTPLIELGKNAQERHYEIGRAAARYCDYLFLTNNNFYNEIIRGVADEEKECIVKSGKVENITKDISGLTEKNDVVVLEGMESGFVKLV